MSIDVRWFDTERSSLYYEFVGKWTWEELYGAIAEGERMGDGTTQKLHVIVDVRRSQYVPMLTAEHLSKVALITTESPALHGMVMVGAGHFVRLMFDIFKRIHPVAAERYRFVDTVDDLKALITAIH